MTGWTRADAWWRRQAGRDILTVSRHIRGRWSWVRTRGDDTVSHGTGYASAHKAREAADLDVAKPLLPRQRAARKLPPVTTADLDAVAALLVMARAAR